MGIPWLIPASGPGGVNVAANSSASIGRAEGCAGGDGGDGGDDGMTRGGNSTSGGAGGFEGFGEHAARKSRRTDRRKEAREQLSSTEDRRRGEIGARGLLCAS
jgi:hypothetical protein